MRDLNLLTVFVHVVRTRSFTRTARQLGTSPSSISKAIRRLEDELDIKLLNRTTRALSLTEDGNTVFKMASRVLDEIQTAEAQVMNARGKARGRLRIQMPVGFGKEVVVPRLPALTRRHPDLTIDIELGDHAADLAASGTDIAISIGPLRDSGLIQKKLCDLRLVFCASRAYLDRYGTPRTFRDLDQHICIGYIPGYGVEYRSVNIDYGGTQTIVTLSGQINVNNAQSSLDLAVAGAGIALVSAFTAYRSVKSGEIEVILKDHVASSGSIYALYLPSIHTSPRVLAFTTFLDQLIASGRWWETIL